MAVITGIKACVFDAYGTLFDVHSAAAKCRDALGDKADEMSEIWRLKQLQYTWLRSLMDEYAPFWEVTGDALDYALAAVGIDDPELRERLMNMYLELSCYPEVPQTLRILKEGGLSCAILSNGSPEMLDAAVHNSNIAGLLDAVISVDGIRIFKPAAVVYRQAVDRFDCRPEEICFMSSNAWDAYAAAHFGFQVAWVNRFGQPAERIPGTPKAEIQTLAELPALLGL